MELLILVAAVLVLLVNAFTLYQARALNAEVKAFVAQYRIGVTTTVGKGVSFDASKISKSLTDKSRGQLRFPHTK